MNVSETLVLFTAVFSLLKCSLVFPFGFVFFLIYFWLHWVFVVAYAAFSSCGERGLLFVAVCGLLLAMASLVAEHGL